MCLPEYDGRLRNVVRLHAGSCPDAAGVTFVFRSRLLLVYCACEYFDSKTINMTTVPHFTWWRLTSIEMIYWLVACLYQDRKLRRRPAWVAAAMSSNYKYYRNSTCIIVCVSYQAVVSLHLLESPHADQLLECQQCQSGAQLGRTRRYTNSTSRWRNAQACQNKDTDTALPH